MPTKSILTLSLALGLAAANGSPAASTPIYKLLYSAPNPSSQGAAPVTAFEVAPGVLYFLSTAQAEGPGGASSFGPSIFSMSEAGESPNLIYSLPFGYLSGALVQAADGNLYGAVYLPTHDGYYYSVPTSGHGLQHFLTGQWSSIVAMTPAPGKIYDSMGTVSQSYGLVRLDEAAKLLCSMRLVRRMAIRQDQ